MIIIPKMRLVQGDSYRKLNWWSRRHFLALEQPSRSYAVEEYYDGSAAGSIADMDGLVVRNLPFLIKDSKYLQVPSVPAPSSPGEQVSVSLLRKLLVLPA
jgi:hypothetical protein